MMMTLCIMFLNDCLIKLKLNKILLMCVRVVTADCVQSVHGPCVSVYHLSVEVQVELVWTSKNSYKEDKQ